MERAYSIKNTKMSLRPLALKSKFTRQFEFLENADGVYAGEQRLALQQLFPYKSSSFLKNLNCQRFLLFNARDLKLGYFDNFNTFFFPFLAFFKL